MRACQLNRRNCYRSLPDADRNGFSRKPLLLEVADLPFFRRHDSADFLRQIDAGFLSQAKRGRVFGDALDPQLFRQRIEEDVAGLVNRLAQIHCAVVRCSVTPST